MSISIKPLDPITITELSDGNSGPYTYSVSGANGYSFPNAIPNITVSSGTSAIWNNTWSNNTSGKIQLNGDEADIKVNDWSLVDAVKRIEERLALLQPNPELEKEWEDLRALGEQYRQLEQHIKEKQATWDRLKAMPPPELDT